MTTLPARATTVWHLADDTGQPLEVVIFQAVAYGAWQAGGTIAAEWADPLSSILHSSTPWRRPRPVAEGATARVTGMTTMTPVIAFAKRVLGNLGSPVMITDSTIAEAAARTGIGGLKGEMFTGYPDQAATWSQLANGELTLEDLEPEAE